MTRNPRIEQLLAGLLRDTATGTIRWGETADEGAFRVALGGGMIRVADDREGPFAALLNKEGKVVEVIEQTDTQVSIRDLYIAARRSALDIDGLLGDMLADLQRGKVTAPPKEPQEPGPDDIPF